MLSLRIIDSPWARRNGVHRSCAARRDGHQWKAPNSALKNIAGFLRLVGNGQHQPPLPAEHRAVDAAGRFREKLAGEQLKLLGQVSEVDF